ncbi:Polyketide cyclase / dehydrase and lipid transport [compost metagenome]
MRNPRLVLMGALLLSLTVSAGAAARASGPAATPATWSAQDVAELQEKPRIIRRKRGVTVSFFVSATPPQAYQLLTEHEKLPEFMPNLDACRVRKQGPGWAEVEMRNPRGMMVLRREFDPPRSIRWSLVESPMLKRVEGSWRLDGVDGGTVLTYDSEVETSVPVPGFVVQFIQRDSLDALVSNVRQRIDSNGTWVKPGFKRGS